MVTEAAGDQKPQGHGADLRVVGAPAFHMQLGLGALRHRLRVDDHPPRKLGDDFVHASAGSGEIAKTGVSAFIGKPNAATVS